jgi:hypothetical protein
VRRREEKCRRLKSRVRRFYARILGLRYGTLQVISLREGELRWNVAEGDGLAESLDGKVDVADELFGEAISNAARN